MKRINKKEKGSIFPKLVVSYIVFSLIALGVLLVGGILTLLFASGGDMNKLIPSQLVLEDGTLDDLSLVYEADGWVEKLNEDYEVVEVYGNKQTPQNSYTAQELLELIRLAEVGHEHLFFYEAFEGGGYLFCYPRKSLKVTFTYEMQGVASNSQQVVIYTILFLLILADGILISVYIYRKIRMPLKQLMNGIQRMERGERDFHISFRADGEFVVIRDAFNRMLAQVKETEAEKVKLQEDRRQMLLELSHDLRSPIATINNCAFALKEGVVAEEERDKYYQMIAAKTNRVDEMADDMFTMLKMESNEYQPSFIRIDFNEFMRQVCAEYYNELEQAGFEVDIDISETQVFVDGDEKLLRRAIGNLLSNVIKYNQSGKYVLIKVLQQGAQVVLIVADDGVPIEQEIHPNMFLAFVRGDKSQRHSSGTGLGLAIAKAVIDKHDGKIQYQYEGERNKFVIELNCYK